MKKVKYVSLLEANKKSKFDTIPESLYYKYRFQQCNPYNGSYCQCTNNYIPLPYVGLCQQNGYNEDICLIDIELNHHRCI